MIAVILAGGKGTRLGELTREIPKPMVRVAGKPVLEYQIELLKRYGITEIIILSNYLGSVIKDYFGDGGSYGVNIRYYSEEAGRPLGTAGSVRAIAAELNEDFLVLYGDVMLDVNLKRFVDFHLFSKGVGTLALHPNNHPYDSDLVEINKSSRIVAFHPKPHAQGKYYHNLDNACLYILSPKILLNLKEGVMSDFGKDVFPKVYKKVALYGYLTAEYIHDMGTPQRLKEVETDIATGKVARLNNENERAAIFLDRDGVINEEVDLLHDPDSFRLLPDVTNAIRLINQSEFLAIIVTNQPVVARNLCTVEGLGEIHKKMESELGVDGAKIDRIYFCPHHPDSGYEGENKQYKVVCECRKPDSGMLKAAARDFNIDLRRSYIIGDSWRDIKAGEKEGLTTILVKTNQKDFDTKATPDYSFSSLLEAVNYILGEK